MALERNYNIHLSRESLVQADAKVTQARSAMLPFLGAEAAYMYFDEELGFAMGSQSLTFMKRDRSSVGLVIRQPIFMGGRLVAGRRAAEYSRNAKSQDNRGVQDEIVFQVRRTYRTAQVAEAFRRVATEAVTLLQAHDHDVAIMVREGAVAELDLLRTRTELANARKELNSANNALDLALSALKNLLVVKLDTPVALTEHLGRRPRPADDLPTLTQLAQSRRPELSSLQCQVAAAEQGLKAAKGKYLPTIALQGRYEYMEGDFRDVDGGGHWTLGVGADVPIWNWGRTASEQAKIQLRKTEDHICLEVRQAFLNLDKAEKNIMAAETALTTGREAFRHAKIRYQAGQGTNTDVLDARTALTRAEANHAQALFEYNVALAALRRAVGMSNIEEGAPGNEGLQK
jgi:outer membrane protein